MSWLLIFALSLAPALYPEGQDPFAFPPAQNVVYEHVFELMEKGDLTTAQSLAEQLSTAVPKNPRVWNALGLIAAQTGKNDEAYRAFTKALELGIDAKRKPSVLAVRSRVLMNLDRKVEAETDARQALALDPKQAMALMTVATLELQRDDHEVAQRHLESAVAAEPTNPQAHLLLAVAFAQAGAKDRALQELATVRALGVHDETIDKMEAELKGPSYLTLAWQVPLGAALFLAVALLGFFIVGSLLSRAEIGRLADVDVHLLRNEQKTGEWIVERLYDLVMWAGTLLFYVSVPLMIILTLAVGAGLLFIIFQLPRIPVQLIVIAVVAAFGGAWSIVRGLFLTSRKEEPGWQLTAADHPRLFAALREVSDVAHSRMVDRVQLEGDSNIGVREAGGTLRVLLGRGERVLMLGYGALRGLTVSELKSILAHEYGHFAHGETRLGPVVGRMIGTLVSILQRMSGLGYSALVNPVYWFLRFYFKVYLRVSAGQSRRRELLADRAAAIGYGGDAFGRALTGVIANGEHYDRLAGELTLLLRESGRPCRNIYRYLDEAAVASSAERRQKRVSEVLDRALEQYDSHPPPKERIQRVAGIPAQRPVEAEPAVSLFSDEEAVQVKLSATMSLMVDAFMDARGIRRAAPKPTEPDEEAALATALAQHQEALEVAEADAAVGEPLLEQSLARLSAVASPHDRCLIRAFTKVANVRTRRGDKAGAQSAFERALSIIESAPEPDPRDLADMRTLVERSRAAAA